MLFFGVKMVGDPSRSFFYFKLEWFEVNLEEQGKNQEVFTMLNEKILQYIRDKDSEQLKVLLAEAEELEILHVFGDLSSKEQVIAFRLLAKDRALSVFEQLDTDLQHNLLNSFADEEARLFVNEMAPDDRVRLFDELPAGVAKKLIAMISPEEREATNLLMGYKPETAGREMTTEYISLQKEMTVAQALEKVRRQAKDKETIYTLFVTDSKKKLEGVVTLKELLIAADTAKVDDVMSKTVISVYADDDQEKVARMLQELDLLAIPVVDSENRLVGMINIDDALDILEEEATEDMFDQAGIIDIANGEASRSDVLVNGSLLSIWKVRLPILLATLVFALFSGVIIDWFEDTLESIAVVAIFIPLIMGMSGNVGTQSSTVFARGVVLGQIQLKNFFKPFLKEIGVGFSIGVVIGVLTGIIAAVWQGWAHGFDLGIALGLSVGLALIAAMTVASLLGFLVPFVLIKLNVDQAAGSAPIITSIKDIVGLAIYFLFVWLFMGNLM